MQKKLKVLGELGVFEVSEYIYQKEKFLSFIYPSTAGNKIVKLFKVLFSNYCKFNCLYCANRKDRDCERYRFETKELAEIFYNLWEKNMVSGLFLSSGIDRDVNETQEKMVEVVKILRKKYGYKGYIHLKILPGVDEYLIRKSFLYADRVSLNLEAISPEYLKKISFEKDFSKNLMNTLEKIYYFNLQYPLKNGITTQLIVGTCDEKDKEILNFSSFLYSKYKVKRVYYSGFIPVRKTPLENHKECCFERQFRLYQADILIRKYGFSPFEIPFDNSGNLYLEEDPKLIWAKRNIDLFPIEINKADFWELIRVPGIGLKSAKKIIEIRKETTLKSKDMLKKIGVRLDKAKDFITLNGKKIKEKNEKFVKDIYSTLFDEVI